MVMMTTFKSQLNRAEIAHIDAFSREENVGVHYVEENGIHGNPLILGEYFKAEKVMELFSNPSLPAPMGPLGD